MKTIVVRPSERPKVLAQGKISYEQIKAERVAPGFIASIKRANSCGQIIVVKCDGTEAFAAPIESGRVRHEGRRHPGFDFVR